MMRNIIPTIANGNPHSLDVSVLPIISHVSPGPPDAAYNPTAVMIKPAIMKPMPGCFSIETNAFHPLYYVVEKINQIRKTVIIILSVTFLKPGSTKDDLIMALTYILWYVSGLIDRHRIWWFYVNTFFDLFRVCA